MSLFNPENLENFRQDMKIRYFHRDNEYQFNTSWGIFSPKQIDEGTQLLLQHLDIAANEVTLDLGCGYGPLGICIAGASPDGSVTMVDRDFIAVEYCTKNIQQNGLTNAQCMLSNGFQHLQPESQFTLVVSNLPAKVGNEMMSLFLHDSYNHLTIGGRLVVVHILGLKNFIKRGFKEVFGNYNKLKQGKNYIVAEATRTT